MITYQKIKKQLLIYILSLIVVVQLSACGGGGEKTVSVGDILSLDEVQVGSCITPVKQGGFIDKLTLNDCNQAHFAEIAGNTTISVEDKEAKEMGHLAITRQAYKDCQPVFEEYTGQTVWESDYDIETIAPSSASWAKGDREVVCLVVGVKGEVLAKRAAK